LQLDLTQEGAKRGCEKQEAEVQEELCNHPGAVGVPCFSTESVAVAAAKCAGRFIYTATAAAEVVPPVEHLRCSLLHSAGDSGALGAAAAQADHQRREGAAGSHHPQKGMLDSLPQGDG
jgi:hypothetical protein